MSELFTLLLGLWVLVVLINEGVTLLGTHVPPVTSFTPVRAKIRERVATDLAARPPGAAYHLLDLGSGHGQLTRDLARAFPQITVTGYEISPIPFVWAWLRGRLAGHKNLQYRYQNFWPVDVSAADAVIVFLDVHVAPRIRKKMFSELRPGALLLSNEIAMQPDWPAQHVWACGVLKTKLFEYRGLNLHERK